MQPDLFPYLGYFGLVDAADVFVLFDNVQYHRRGWMHRNRVQDAAKGWRYVGVPTVKAPRETCIRDIRLQAGWRAQLFDALVVAYREHAQYADDLLQWLSGVLDLDTDALHELNRHTLQATALHLGLACRFASATEVRLARDPLLPLWDWARQACDRFDGTAYLNLPGGAELYPPAPFVERGLGLGFIQPELVRYSRGAGEWEPGLSILDVIAHCGPAGAGAHVRRYRVDWTASVKE